MRMNQEEIDEMHSIQLDLIKEVDRICKKNNIAYSIFAGTLLGAVRHQGYIPWDKDADLAMLRSEYEKFVAVCQRDMNHDLFYFQDHNVTEGYRWGYGKIRKKNTIWLREGQSHMPYPCGVGIDIFPLDYAPNDLEKRKKHDKICTIVRKFGWCAVGRYDEKKASTRFLYKLMYLIPEKTAKGFLNSWIAYSNREETDVVRILTLPFPTNGFYGFHKKWLTELEDHPFEDGFFPGAKDAHGYLSFTYGDYMSFPPASEQVVDGASYYHFTDDTPPLTNTKK